MRKALLVWVIASLALAGFTGCTAPVRAPGAAPPRIIDLGHDLSPADPSWSGEAVFSRTTLATIEKDTVAMGRFATDEHFGTHVDAPSHFAVNGLTVDQLIPDRLIGSGFCINVAAKAAGNEDYQVSVADIEAFEAAHTRIPVASIVFIATGWDARWPDRARYMNERDKVKHFPGLSVEAAKLLAVDRRVAAIGIDTPSIDYGPSTAYDAHRATAPEGVYHIENATRLTELPTHDFQVIVAPIKIQGGSGGPARVFALVKPLDPNRKER